MTKKKQTSNRTLLFRFRSLFRWDLTPFLNPILCSCKHIIICVISTVTVVAAFPFNQHVILTVNCPYFIFTGRPIPFSQKIIFGPDNSILSLFIKDTQKSILLNTIVISTQPSKALLLPCIACNTYLFGVYLHFGKLLQP